MKLQDPDHPKTHAVPHWHLLQLPVGLKVAVVKESTDRLDLALPDFGEKGLTLTFINYKGELLIVKGDRPDRDGQSHGQPDRGGQAASPGMGLLAVASLSMLFRSSAPISFSALVLFIPGSWINLFLKENSQFKKIEQVLEEAENVITSRLGRRQMALFSSALTHFENNRKDLLRIQNSALCLLEYFFCNRHRSLLGVNPASDIDNEDDLTLIREVESYISEYYCSDTFTVDSILKKTYTSYHRLNFLFKSIHGMTISEYIRNKRIEKSKEMIADNAKSISQIAYEIGYSSISNYILAFKKVYQITPGKYKKQMDNML
jgi:AraC-like DNA-binding protein